MTLTIGEGVATQPAAQPVAVPPAGEISASPFAGLSFWARIKYHLMYSGIPLGAGLLIGLIGGYLIGRKRK